jgi:hypothetical protein
MYNKELEEKIFNFSKQMEFTPAQYISKLLKEYYDNLEYIEIFKNNLCTKDYDCLDDTLNFLGYLLNETTRIPGNLDEELVHEINKDDELFDLLSKLLYSEKIYFRKRALAFYSLTEYEDFEKLLIDTFDYKLRKDPLLIPEIIVTLCKLNAELNWEYIDKIVNSESWLIRWSFFNLFDFMDMNYSKTDSYVNKLKEENNILIKNEAVYYENYLQIINEGVSNNPFYRKYQTKRINEKIPEYTYTLLKSEFINYQYKSGIHEYDLQLLEEFVEFYQVNKKTYIVDLFIENKKRELST